MLNNILDDILLKPLIKLVIFIDGSEDKVENALKSER